MDAGKIKIPWVYWLIVVLGVFWHAAGSVNFFMQSNLDFVASLPESHRAIVVGRPGWATGGFAIGVFGGLLACLLLLFRKSSAGLLFLISLVGIFVTMIHSLNVVLAKEVFSISDIFIMIVLPLVVANFYIGFTFFSMRRNWLR